MDETAKEDELRIVSIGGVDMRVEKWDPQKNVWHTVDADFPPGAAQYVVSAERQRTRADRLQAEVVRLLAVLERSAFRLAWLRGGWGSAYRESQALTVQVVDECIDAAKAVLSDG